MLLSLDSTAHLKALGDRLRRLRLERNETQAVFAARIGTSIPTLLRMESGDPKVQFGFWVAALDVLGRLEDLSPVLAVTDLFERLERSSQPRRKRASGRGRGG